MSNKDKKLSGREKERLRRQEKKRQQQRLWIFYTGVALLVVGGIAIFAFANQPEPLTAAEIDQVNLARIDGPADAPVQIIEFGDFGCPACQAWHNSRTKESIQANFGDQVAFTFLHFPVITADSPRAAEASFCAAEQDLFWEYHDVIYEVGNGLGDDQLVSYATAAGLQTEPFTTCLRSGKYEQLVQDDLREARGIGARGTPTFFVNGQLVANPNAEVLAKMIFAELNPEDG